jgi:hypothetical protein
MSNLITDGRRQRGPTPGTLNRVSKPASKPVPNRVANWIPNWVHGQHAREELRRQRTSLAKRLAKCHHHHHVDGLLLNPDLVKLKESIPNEELQGVIIVTFNSASDHITSSCSSYRLTWNCAAGAHLTSMVLPFSALPPFALLT